MTNQQDHHVCTNRNLTVLGAEKHVAVPRETIAPCAAVAAALLRIRA